MELNVQKRIKELNDAVTVCKTVESTIKTEGWQKIVEPLIDKMIGDICGAKLPNGRWHGGALIKARKDERREYYVGYKQALIDLHGRVHAYADNIKRLEDERGQLIAGASQKFTTPLIDDTSYGRNFDG